MARQDPVEARHELSPVVPPDDFLDAHQKLDAVERRLERLRRLQEYEIDGAADVSRRRGAGQIHHVDLRTMLDLDAIDDELNQRTLF